MFRIEHVAIWVNDLESMRDFYCKYFRAEAGARYYNEKKNFTSYFLSFSSGARLELMHKPDLASKSDSLGLAHFAISLGSEEEVNVLTQRLEKDGFKKNDGPRWTGDGYYESVFEDPEGNLIELTI